MTLWFYGKGVERLVGRCGGNSGGIFWGKVLHFLVFGAIYVFFQIEGIQLDLPRTGSVVADRITKKTGNVSCAVITVNTLLSTLRDTWPQTS